MAIDFTLTKEQQELQAMARSFAQEVLAPLAPKVDAEPDPFAGWQMAQAGLRGGLQAGHRLLDAPEGSTAAAGCPTWTS